ncbi:hypothetical protein L6164_017100 [Bauhinia variegata]|uniref:Uncharacterized protein n=1 Tax=Bauhinia variegata TaxID=167791 RepID=A0ACB9N6S4_BAUVA|nr:hypothetical protein L6164_017100 [Bauhinia variegata]
MAEIGISIAAKVAEYLVQPVIRHGQYLFCINKLLKNLQDKMKELMSTRDSVLIRVEEAKQKTQRIEDVVQKWLTDVQSLLEEVEKLEQQVQASNTCFRGMCPTWKRYLLCKQMVLKTKVMAEFNNKSNFKTFARLATLPGIEYSSTEDFTFFESTKLAYAQLLEALQDDGIYRIGLYGMGGSGKTTLVTEVGKKAKESNLFDRVVAITVSQTPNIRNIQGQMADMLNIKLEEESDEGRAQRLHMRLKEEKKILIIVDDVWGEFNLKNIGIAFDICHNGSCKVILTTRRQQVCTLMDCQKKILLELLNEDESWTLLQKHAQLDDQSSLTLLNTVAQDVARECKGLPIAIQAVGKSLKGMSINEWKVARENLRRSEPVDVEDGLRDAFSCLKLSYDYLKDEIKLLFLMCCIFPEDHEFSIEDLIRCGAGLGVCREYQSFDLARNLVTMGINKLLDSCLLMHAKNKNQSRKEAVKMHDIIRDLSLWIASKEGRTIMVNLSTDLNSLIRDGAIKNYFALSSWYGHTSQISNQLVFPKLEILWIQTDSSLDMSSISIEGLQGLKVMVLICNNSYEPGYLSLSPFIGSLTNLRTLCLRGWKLDDISFVVRLIRLEVLELKSCLFNELPNEIGNLDKLKLLDLSECAILENYEATGELSQIEELYVTGAFHGGRWIHPSPSFVDNIAATNLQRYALKFAAGPFLYKDVFPEDLITRAIYLKSVSISSFSVSLKNLLQRAEYVHFNDLHGDCQNFIPTMIGAVGGMNDLAVLRLGSCLETKCVLDSSSGQVVVELPSLVKLYLEDMKNLKEVCCGPPPLGFFERLQELCIWICPQLHSIFSRDCKLTNLKILRIGRDIKNWWSTHCRVAALFSVSVARSLAQLEVLSIGYCEELKHIITPDEDGDGANTGEEIVPASYDSHLILPNLKRLSVFNCHKLEFILPVSFIENVEQLQEIEIENASQLKYVFGQYDQNVHSSHQKNIQIPFPILKVLTLKRLDNLHSICSEKYNPRCPSLKELYVHDCPKLTTLGIMICMEMGQLHLCKGLTSEESQQKQLISKLEKLYLEDLPELMSLWSVPTPRQSLSLQHLQELKVEKCHKLKCLFPMVFHGSLPELTYLTVDECDELEEIMEENKELKNLNNPQVCFPKLKMMKINSCRKLKSLFPVSLARMLPQLSTLQISYADQLEEVFRKSSEESTKEIEASNLKELKLEKLSSFVGICPGRKLHAVNLLKMDIDDCPKFDLIFEATQVIPHHLKAEGVADRETEQKYLIPKLEKLNLEKFPELNSIWTVPTLPQVLSLQRLQELHVRKCDKIKCLFSKVVSRNLPELTSLIVDKCEELEEIMEENEELENLSNAQVCFPKLKMIQISFCRKLKSLFPVASARMLPQLSTLHISCADQLKVIFRKSSEEGTSNGQEIVVLNLEELKLTKLPSFVSICPGLKLHAVKMVIDECPKLAPVTEAAQVFPCHGITEASATNDSQVTGEEQGKNVMWSANWMYLNHLQYLDCIGKEPTSMDFKNLICLRVSGCRKLKFIFCAGRSLCLPELKYLYVENCEELKEIISEYPGHLEIRKCSQIEQLFCCQTSESNDGVLPNLKRLILRGLPSLTHIFGGSDQLRLPYCRHYTAIDCPKFSISAYAARRSILHPFEYNNMQDLVDFEILNEDYHYYDGFHTYDRYAALETFQLSLQGYSPGGLESKIQELNAVDEFLRPNYDSENEERRGKNKRIAGQYRFSTYSQEELEAVDYTICPYGWFKAYFDVATTEEKSWASALLVNHEGKLIGARTRKLSTKFHLEQQALALELAIELARDVVPKSNICLEGDCQRVFSILHDYLNDKMDSKVWYLVPILMDVREKLGSMGDWEGTSICRNLYWVAYNAANWAALCDREGDVLNSVPAIEVLSKEDFLSSFFTEEEDDHNHDKE